MSFALIVFALSQATFCALTPVAGGPQEQQKNFTLESAVLAPAVPLAESPNGVVLITLTANVNEKSEGKGRLFLDPNRRNFDESGEPTIATRIANIELDCSLRFLKMGKIALGPGRFEEKPLFAVEGKKIVARMHFLATSKDYKGGRLLIGDKDGNVAYVVELRPPDIQPCHPGCFPAGTQVQTPDGLKAIETIRSGDSVTTVPQSGECATGKVQSVFVTDNQLVKIETDDGVLLTTATQPLCLADGQIRPTEELKTGESICRWSDGKRRAVKILRISPAERREKVFNLILRGSEVFIANGFLARSKPPAAAPTPAITAGPEIALPGSRE